MNKLNVFGPYLNAKVEWNGYHLPCIINAVEQGAGWLILEGNEGELYRASPEDCTLLLRSLDSLTEEEAKEYWELYKKSPFHDTMNKDSYSIYMAGGEVINQDWLREHNLETKYKGEDLIELGIAKINNEAYK